jgi:hypothetical protein
MAIPNQVIIDSPTNTVEIQTNDNQLHIISPVCNTEVNVTQPVTTIIQVAAPGPQGQQGTLLPSNSGSFNITGSLTISGSFTVTGSSNFNGPVYAAVTGSLLGTASYAEQALSASYAVSSSYAVSASYAFQATSASYALSASYSVTASYAEQATSSSYALSASYAVSASYASASTSASYALSASYAVSASHAPTSVSASYALSSSYALSASYAVSASNSLTASYLNPLQQDVFLTGSLFVTGSVTISGSSTFTNIGPAVFSGSISQTANTASLSYVTASVVKATSFTGSFSGSFFGDGSGITNISASSVIGLDLNRIDTGSVSASVNPNNDVFTVISASDTLFSISSSGAVYADSFVGSFTGSLSGSFTGSGLITSASYALSASYAVSASQAVSSSYAVSASQAARSVTASFADTIASGLNITASNLFVAGAITASSITAQSASFGYLQTVTGSAVIIGQEYIILNTQAPAARFAGLKVYDSGSNHTGSLVWDSLRNHWVYENEEGASYSGGGLMSGPRNTGSLGDETYPTLNTVLRGQGGDHLYNSNITDDDSNVRMSIPLIVTGSVQATSFTGSVSGSVSAPGSTTQIVYNNGGVLAADSGLVYSGSRVGIGTSTPSSTLQVAGTSSLQNIVYDANSTYDIGTISTRVRNIWSNGSIVGVDGFFNRITAYFTASIGGGANGFAPSATLHVSGASSDNLLRIDSPASSSILFVSGSGNVGIGTSTPITRLDVNGRTRISGNGGPVGAIGGTTYALSLQNNGVTTWLEMLNNRGAGRGAFFGLDGDNFEMWNYQSGSINFYTSPTVSAGTQRMTITKDGNVGIGETSPGARLEVKGSGTTSATTTLRIENANSSASLEVRDDRLTRITSEGAALFVEGAGVTPFSQPIAEFRYIGNSNSLIISQQGGSAGLTTSADANLNISPSGSGVTVFLTGKQVRLNNSNNNGTFALQNTGATGQSRLDFITGSTTVMSISGSGNIGIGTTTPTSASLTVNGNVWALSYTGSFTGSVAAPGSTTQVVYNNGGVLSADSGLVYSGSRVGIGTATPTANLVVSSGSAPTLKLENTANIATTGWAGTTVSSLDFSTTDPTIPGTYARISTVGGPGSVGGGLEGDLVFSTAPSNSPNSIAERVRISSTGNVGIGTTTPSASLHISGASSANLLRISSPASSNILFVSGSGNVGIGITTPISRLQVTDSVAGDAGVTIQNSNEGTGNTAALWFKNASSTSDYRKGAIFYRNDGSGQARGDLYFALNSVASSAVATTADAKMVILNSGNVGIGVTSPTNRLQVRGSGTTSATTALRVEDLSANPSLVVLDNGWVGVDIIPTSASLHVNGNAYISASFSTSSAALTVFKSGSTVLDVQGSQGQLFSITDSLSGSLFSVNDISGLPILEVFSDNTILMGDYIAPSLNTTEKLTVNSGVTTLYALPTASYDGAFFEYTIRSGSNSRAGSIMGIWSGSSVNYTETTTVDFGNTSGFNFGMSISGANMILSSSAATSGWTFKTIIRSI